MSWASNVTLVLPSTIGTPLARDVYNVCAMLLVPLVKIVMILVNARVRPILLGVGVIRVFPVTMDSQQVAGVHLVTVIQLEAVIPSAMKVDRARVNRMWRVSNATNARVEQLICNRTTNLAAVEYLLNSPPHLLQSCLHAL